jgi:hypothetical protein
MSLPVEERDEALRKHALERKLGLRVLPRLPMDEATLDTLREDFPKLTFVERGAPSKATAKTLRAGSAGPHVPRGRSFHVNRGLPPVREALARMKGQFAILGSNRSWTTIFPLTPGFHPPEATTFGQLFGDILELAVDDETGLQARWHVKGGNFGGDLQIAWERPFEEDGVQRVFLLTAAGHLSKTKGLMLRDQLHRQVAERDAWLRARGLESALGLSVVEPVPQETTIPLAERGERGALVSLPPYEAADAAELRRFGLLREEVGRG